MTCNRLRFRREFGSLQQHFWYHCCIAETPRDRSMNNVSNREPLGTLPWLIGVFVLVGVLVALISYFTTRF